MKAHSIHLPKFHMPGISPLGRSESIQRHIIIAQAFFYKVVEFPPLVLLCEIMSARKALYARFKSRAAAVPNVNQLIESDSTSARRLKPSCLVHCPACSRASSVVLYDSSTTWFQKSWHNRATVEPAWHGRSTTWFQTS